MTKPSKVLILDLTPAAASPSPSEGEGALVRGAYEVKLRGVRSSRD